MRGSGRSSVGTGPPRPPTEIDTRGDARAIWTWRPVARSLLCCFVLHINPQTSAVSTVSTQYLLGASSQPVQRWATGWTNGI
jgi:hypothetical protein